MPFSNPTFVFTAESARVIDHDTGELPTIPRSKDGQPATIDLSVHLARWLNTTALCILGGVTIVLVAFAYMDTINDMFAPVISAKLTTGAAVTVVLFALVAGRYRDRRRIDRLVRESRARHEENVAKLDQLAAAVGAAQEIQDAAAHIVAAGQQMQARFQQVTDRLRRVEADRAAEGEAREALERALVAGVAKVVGDGLTDFGARITAVEQAMSASRDDLHVIGATMDEMGRRLNHSEAATVEGRAKLSEAMAEALFHLGAMTARLDRIETAARDDFIMIGEVVVETLDRMDAVVHPAVEVETKVDTPWVPVGQRLPGSNGASAGGEGALATQVNGSESITEAHVDEVFRAYLAGRRDVERDQKDDEDQPPVA